MGIIMLFKWIKIKSDIETVNYLHTLDLMEHLFIIIEPDM